MIVSVMNEELFFMSFYQLDTNQCIVLILRIMDFCISECFRSLQQKLALFLI